jgi:hypothetical protein
VEFIIVRQEPPNWGVGVAQSFEKDARRADVATAVGEAGALEVLVIASL